MADWGQVQFCIVVAYTDGSAVLGCYGSFKTRAGAEQAIPLLRELPGMDPGNDWTVQPLCDIPEILKLAKPEDGR